MNLVSAIYPSFYPFEEMGLFSKYYATSNPNNLTKEDCLVVWGGGDISPTLYKREVSKHTYATHKLSDRDIIEWQLMKRAKELGIPIIGICRGAQMLCALTGGFLIQDVTNHGRSHPVITNDGQQFLVSSLHHQMLYPFEVDHLMVAQSAPAISEHYMDVNTPVEVPVEPEFVYFPKEKGIAIQWHPEFMDVDCEANTYLKGKLKELL